jgi:hypothetical protein
MNFRIEGIKPPDEEWQKKKAAWDACIEAGIDAPEQLWDFFEGETPDDEGVVVELGCGPDEYETAHDALEPYREEMVDGYVVDLAKLPADIKKLRFVLSWD